MDSEPVVIGYEYEVKLELEGLLNDSADGEVISDTDYVNMPQGAGSEAHDSQVFADPKIEVEDVKVLGSPVVGDTPMISMNGNDNDGIVNGNDSAENAIQSTSNSLEGLGNGDVDVKMESNEEENENVSSSSGFILPDLLEPDPDVMTPPGPGSYSSCHENGFADTKIEVVQVDAKLAEEHEDLQSASVMDSEAVEANEDVDLAPDPGRVSEAPSAFPERVATTEKPGLRNGWKRNSQEPNFEVHVRGHSRIEEVIDSVARGANSQSSQSQELLPPPRAIPSPLVPPNWQSHLDEVKGSSAPYKIFPVDNATLEYQSITKLVSPLRVVSISQVVNPELWRQYTTRRNDMILEKSNDASLVFRLRRMSDDDDRTIRHSPNTPQYLEDRHLTTAGLPQYSPNDTLLLHCTAGQKNLERILAMGLDHMTTYGCRLGEGVYFSDNPEYVVAFDGTTPYDNREGSRSSSCGTGTVLIFSVLLGDCLSLPELPGKGRGSLEYEPKKVRVQMRNQINTSFESITAIKRDFKGESARGGGGGNNEYVIFHKSQCCPLYMVKYNMPRNGSFLDKGDGLEAWRGKTPPLAWSSPPGSEVPPMPSHYKDRGWPFLSENIFGEMGVTAMSAQDQLSIDSLPATVNGHANVGTASSTQSQFDIIDDIIGSVDTLLANSASFKSRRSNKRKLAGVTQPNSKPKRGNMDTRGQEDNQVAGASFSGRRKIPGPKSARISKKNKSGTSFPSTSTLDSISHDVAQKWKMRPCHVNLERPYILPNNVPKATLRSLPPPRSPPPATLTTLSPPPVISSPLQPPNWEDHISRAMWSSSTFETYFVTSQEFQAIKELVCPLQIFSVQQIVNPELWQNYKNKYKDMLMRNSDNPILLEMLGMARQDILQRAQNRQDFIPDPNLQAEATKYSPNEVILFHCSSDDKLNKIFNEGLDGKTSYECKFGDRIYFSDDPRICIKWDETSSKDGEATGVGTLLIFSVLLGDCLSVEELQHKSILRRGYLPRKVGEQKRHINDGTFDSMTGVMKYSTGQSFTKSGSNQYVIFDQTQCCPLYIVRYRSTGRTPGDCAETYARARSEKPPISWKPIPGAVLAMPSQNLDGRWPMYAKALYERMGVLSIGENYSAAEGQRGRIREKLPNSGTVASASNSNLDPTSLIEKLSALVSLGFLNDLENREALQRCTYNVEEAVNFLLDHGSRPGTSASQGYMNTSSNESETVPVPSSSTEISNSTSLFQLTEISPTLNGIRRQLPHLVRATALTPPNWMENMRLVIRAMASFSSFPVDRATQEYRTIAQLLQPLPVTSVEQVVNPTLWQQYENKRKEMLLAKSEDPDLLVHLGLDKNVAEERARLAQQQVKNNRVLQISEQYSPNEAFLLHATRSAENLEKILSHGLDETTTYWKDFGREIHFGDDPIFISEFDGTFKKKGPGQDKSQQSDSDTGTILIFTVLLGDCLSRGNLSHQGQDDLGSEPEKLRVQMRNQNDLTFDSVTMKTQRGSNKLRNEYITFNKAQSCPLYMVRYKRNQFLKGDIGGDYVTSREELPTVAWRDLPVVKTPMPNQSLDGSWPFYAETVYKKMRGGVESDPANDPTPSKSNEPEPGCSSSTRMEIQTVCKNLNLVTTRLSPLQPPNWLVNIYRTNASLAKCRTFPINHSTKEYQIIAELVSPLNVLSIEQTVNPRLWKRYMDRRKEMLELKSEDMYLLKELGLKINEYRRYDLTRDTHLISESATYSPNEVLLLHSIRTVENLEQILVQGLDETSTYGCRLGNEIYFTDDPLISVGNEVGAIGTILVFAVMLGDCLALAKFPGNGSVSDSEYVPKKANVQKRHSDDVTFDSITFPKGMVRPGPKSKKKLPNQKTSNEYVIFDKAQCCPIYIIKYERGQVKEMEANGFIGVFQTARRQPPTVAWRRLPFARSDPVLPNVPMPNQELDKSWPFYADALFQRMGVEPDEKVKVNRQTLGDAVKSEIERKLHNHGFTNPTNNRIAMYYNNMNYDSTLRFLQDRANLSEDEWFRERIRLAYTPCRITLLPLPWSDK